MNQQINELRNVLVGITKKINSLDRKVDLSVAHSIRAKEYSELARDISLRQLQGDLQKQEINTIRNLFSGSSPSLDEMINCNGDEVTNYPIDIFDNILDLEYKCNNENSDNDKNEKLIKNIIDSLIDKVIYKHINQSGNTNVQ